MAAVLPGLTNHLCEAEVGELERGGAAGGEEQVLGLDVAVHQDRVAVVQVGQRAQQVPRPAPRGGAAEVEAWAAAGEVVREARASHELHQQHCGRRRRTRKACVGWAVAANVAYRLA